MLAIDHSRLQRMAAFYGVPFAVADNVLASAIVAKQLHRLGKVAAFSAANQAHLNAAAMAANDEHAGCDPQQHNDVLT